MALKDTTQELNHLLSQMQKDLSKVARGNKAASQRIRTSTIQMEKVGKLYRKESVLAEKTGRFKKPKSPSSIKKPLKRASLKKS